MTLDVKKVAFQSVGMAYEAKDFITVTSDTDDIATMSTAGYLNIIKDSLKLKNLLWVVATDDEHLYKITDLTTDVVTTLII